MEIVRAMRSLVAYHQVLGIQDYPVKAARLSARGREDETSDREVRAGAGPGVAVSETLQDIAADIDACTNCELHGCRLARIPGQGSASARLLIVGHWLTVSQQDQSAATLVFGREEDLMLARMREAIHLAPADIFVTNILKCGLSTAPELEPGDGHVRCCLAYLRRQIAVIAPKVICTMGTVPTRALLQQTQSLSRLRGKFHVYSSLDGTQIPLIPTYHPSYLLKAPEMKSETWKDLLLIGKKLAE